MYKLPSAIGSASPNRPAALQRRLSKFNISEDTLDQQKKKRNSNDEDKVIRDLIAKRKKGMGF
jgi:hypothetical protein